MSYKNIDKNNMMEDIFLSVACILSIVIMYFFASVTDIFNTRTAVDYISYSVCVVVLAKVLFHVIKIIYLKIKNKSGSRD